MIPMLRVVQVVALYSVVIVSLLADGPVPVVTWADAEARLKLAQQLAREKNDNALVERVVAATTRAKAAFREGGGATEADKIVREIETAVGIDPGGWSMNGLKVFHPTPQILAGKKALDAKLATAMAKDDPAQVQAVIVEMRNLWGDQAGLPDARRLGIRAEAQPLSQKKAVDLFLTGLESDASSLRRIASGKTVGSNMLRVYAAITSACCDIRRAVEKHRPDSVSNIDQLIAGSCAVQTALQRPEGFFPFPDLRGKNIRFGEMAERVAAKNPTAFRDGWMIVPDPDGGSQFDTGLCGVALLSAGEMFHREELTKAGLRAADWALAQRCVPNFNYNSFSVSLLSRAWLVSHQERYLRAAIQKFRVGVAPGQVDSGRWIDPHNARTVYHLIILRALHDLWEALPAEQTAMRQEVSSAAIKAVGTVLDEIDAAGVTVPALSELVRHASLNSNPDGRLSAAMDKTAAVILQKCVRSGRIHIGVPIGELAALVQWSKASPAK